MNSLFENDKTDNQSIGIILSEGQDDIMVEYAMLNDNANLIVLKYQLFCLISTN